MENQFHLDLNLLGNNIFYKILPYLFIFLSFFSCSSVFTNPDIQENTKKKLLKTSEISFIPYSIREARITKALHSDSIFPTDFDFYWLQNSYFDFILKNNIDSSNNISNFNSIKFAPQKSIFDSSGMMGPIFYKESFLEQLKKINYTYIEFDNITTASAIAILSLKYPLIAWGKTRQWRSHIIYQPETSDSTQELQTCFNYNSFVLINGFKRFLKKGNLLPNESPAKVIFTTRDNINFITDGNRILNNLAIEITPPTGKANTRLFTNFYLVIPSKSNKDKIIQNINELLNYNGFQEVVIK